MIFKNIRILVLRTKIASALEGLMGIHDHIFFPGDIEGQTSHRTCVNLYNNTSMKSHLLSLFHFLYVI